MEEKIDIFYKEAFNLEFNVYIPFENQDA